MAILICHYENVNLWDRLLDGKERIAIDLKIAKSNKVKIGLATKKRIQKIKESAIKSVITSVINDEDIKRLENTKSAIINIEVKLKESQQTKDLENILDENSFQVTKSQIELAKVALKQINRNISHQTFQNKNFFSSDSKQKWKNIDTYSNADAQVRGENLKFKKIESTLKKLDDEIERLDRLIKKNKIKLSISSNSDQIVSKIIAILNSQSTKKALGNALISLGVTGYLLNIMLDALFHDGFEQYLSNQISEYIDPFKRINISQYSNGLQDTINTILNKTIQSYPINDRLTVYTEIFEKIKKVNYDLDEGIDKVCKGIYFRMKEDFKFALNEKAKSLDFSDYLLEQVIENLNRNTVNSDLIFRKKLDELNRLVNTFNKDNINSKIELGNFFIRKKLLSSDFKKEL